MRLIRMKIRSFGKLKDKELLFSPGINIIWGPNESGKSTVHSFLKCMLFGITRQRGRAAKHDLYSRYEPWERPADFSGVLWFESGGKEFRLERSFYKNDIRVSLVCVTDGEELSVENGDLEMLLGEVGERVFENTVSVGQLASETDAALVQELQNYMANYQGGMDGEIDILRAVESLKKKRKIWENRKLEEERKQEEIRKNLEQRTQYLYRETEELQQQLRTVRQQKTEYAEELKAMQAKTRQDSGASGTKGRNAGRRGGLFCFPAILLGLALVFYGIWNPLQLSLLIQFLEILLGFAALATGLLLYEKKEDGEREDPYGEAREILSRLVNNRERLAGREEALANQLQEKETLRENLEEDLEELTGNSPEIRQCSLEIESIQLAETTIRRLSEDMRLRLGERLRIRMGEILGELTEGRYSQVSLDSGMRIRLGTRDGMIPLENLSRGTVEQAYFSLRMAVSELLCREEELPLLLDEVFAMYDDRRLVRALKWLESEKEQTLIFSCHGRESALAKTEGIGVTDISLADPAGT